MSKITGWVSNHRTDVIVLLLGATLLVFHLMTLMRWPPVFVDEAWNANRAWGFLETGIPFGSMDFNEIQDLPGYENYYPRLPVFIQAFVIRLVGFPNQVVLRLVSFLGGIVLLFAMVSIATALAGRKAGIFVFFLVGISLSFFYSAHLARTDIFAAAFGYWALAFVLNSSSSNVVKNLIAGLMVGAAIEFHPIGLIFGPTILVLRLLQDGWSGLKKTGMWGLLLGLTLGAFFYLSIHVIPNPQTYFDINRLIFSTTHGPPILSGDIRLIQRSATNTIAYLSNTIPLQLGLSLFSILAVMACQFVSKEKKLIILVLISMPLLVFLLFVRIPFFYNLILITPLLDLIVVIFLAQLTQRKETDQLWKTRLSLVVFGMVVAGYVLFVPLLILQGDYWEAFSKNMTKVQSYIQSTDQIMGDQIFWFGIYKNHYDGWEELVYYHENTPNSTWEDALTYFHPDIFILDSWVLTFVKDQPKESDLYKRLWIPYDELEAALNSHGRIIAEIDGGLYGDIHLYRLTWP